MLTRLANFLRHPVTLCLFSFFGCLFIALLLSFPLAPFGQRLEQLAGQQGLEMRLVKPELAFPLRLEVAELILGHPQIEHPPLEFTDLVVVPLWSTLFGDEPGVGFSAKILQGEIDGTAYRSGQATAMFAGLEINEPLTRQLPLRLSGVLEEGEFAGRLPLQGDNTSQLQIEMRDLQLTGLRQVGGTTDLLPLGRLRCTAEAVGPLIKITRLTLAGEAFNLAGQGTLRLGQTPTRSQINLDLTLVPRAGLEPQLRELLALLLKPQQDGSFRLQLRGPLSNPRSR